MTTATSAMRADAQSNLKLWNTTKSQKLISFSPYNRKVPQKIVLRHLKHTCCSKNWIDTRRYASESRYCCHRTSDTDLKGIDDVVERGGISSRGQQQVVQHEYKVWDVVSARRTRQSFLRRPTQSNAHACSMSIRTGIDSQQIVFHQSSSEVFELLALNVCCSFDVKFRVIDVGACTEGRADESGYEWKRADELVPAAHFLKFYWEGCKAAV